MPTKSQLITAAITIGIFAALMRVQPAKDAILGDNKFLGIF